MAFKDYKMLNRQLTSLIEEDNGYVPVLSNLASLLWSSLDDINWSGFYIVKENELVLGPFQGKLACIHIPYGSGVCGTAWKENATQLVPDVHQFPGHIACDSASNSEIVVPVRKDGEVVAVIDIDSPNFSRFDPADAEGLEETARILGESVCWD